MLMIVVHIVVPGEGGWAELDYLAQGKFIPDCAMSACREIRTDCQSSGFPGRSRSGAGCALERDGRNHCCYSNWSTVQTRVEAQAQG